MRLHGLNLYALAATASIALGACGGGGDGDAFDMAPVGEDGSEVLAAEAVKRDGLVAEPAVLLEARSVVLAGNPAADEAESVMLGGSSTVGGSVQIKQGGGASIVGADITGDLQVDAMRAPVSATSNRVNGSVQVMGSRGGVAMTRNTVGGNLQCKDNLPPPVGSGNRAASKEDQCSTL
jgi:hypothetical protein